MNREIIFRGRRTAGGNWVEGSLLVYDDGDCFICCQDVYPDVMNKYEVAPATVGQFVGWIDRHGTWVFDGDIIHGFNDLHQRWEKYTVKWWYNNGFYMVDDCESGWHPEHVENQEVIGNIHDTPELLQG